MLDILISSVIFVEAVKAAVNLGTGRMAKVWKKSENGCTYVELFVDAGIGTQEEALPAYESDGYDDVEGPPSYEEGWIWEGTRGTEAEREN